MPATEMTQRFSYLFIMLVLTLAPLSSQASSSPTTKNSKLSPTSTLSEANTYLTYWRNLIKIHGRFQQLSSDTSEILSGLLSLKLPSQPGFWGSLVVIYDEQPLDNPATIKKIVTHGPNISIIQQDGAYATESLPLDQTPLAFFLQKGLPIGSPHRFIQGKKGTIGLEFYSTSDDLLASITLWFRKSQPLRLLAWHILERSGRWTRLVFQSDIQVSLSH